MISFFMRQNSLQLFIFFFFLNENPVFHCRPPPKVARRVGPVPDTPTTTTIIETPPSPSMTTFGHSPSPSNNSQTTSDSNVKPSEFLRHKHNDEKLSSVLLKYTQHGNITKSGQNSSSESLINSTNNEETLHVESFPISERVRTNIIS